MTDIHQDKLINIAKESLSEHTESKDSECVSLLVLSVQISDRTIIVHSYRR